MDRPGDLHPLSQPGSEDTTLNYLWLVVGLRVFGRGLIGNKLGTVLATSAPCGHNAKTPSWRRASLGSADFKHHRNLFPIPRHWQRYRTQNPVLETARNDDVARPASPSTTTLLAPGETARRRRHRRMFPGEPEGACSECIPARARPRRNAARNAQGAFPAPSAGGSPRPRGPATRRALGLRQVRQGGDVADAGQVGVHSPVVQGPAARSSARCRAACGAAQVGPEPVQGPAPELGAGRAHRATGHPCPARNRPAPRRRRRRSGRRPAGSSASFGSASNASARRRSGGVTLRGVENRGQGHAFGVVRGAVVASEESRQAVGEGGELLGPGDPLGRRVAPVGPLRAELVSYAELGQ